MATRRSYHHGNLQEALVSAALALAREGGAAAVSLRAVSQRAGVSRAAPYHHFRDKEALLAAVAATGFDLLTAEIERSIAGLADPWLALRTMGRTYVQFTLRERELVRMMFGENFSDKSEYPELLAAGRRSFGLLLSVVTRCLAEPDARPLAPLPAAMTCWSTVHGLSMLRADGTVHVLCYFTEGAAGEEKGPLDEDAVSAQVLVLLEEALRQPDGSQR